MSSNQELLRTTSIKGLTAARTGGPGPIESYGRLIEIIRKQCGDDAASLFSEPALPAVPEPDNPQLTWYTPLGGQMVDLASIDEMARRPVIARLRERLQKLKPVLEDPEIGPTVASWLYIPTKDDLLSVGGNPVLINWGFLPTEIANSATRRETHFEDTIGRYAVEHIPAPPFTAQEAASYSARFDRRARRSAEAMGSETLASDLATQPNGPQSRLATASDRFQAWPPLIASLIAAAVFLFLLLPGVLIFPSQVGRGDTNRNAELLREDNRNLAERLRQLESAAKENVCRQPNGQLAPLTRMPGRTRAPTPNLRNADLLPPSPRQIQIPPAPNASAAAPRSLAELVDPAVVFIFGSTGHGIGTGSGFFVTRDRIVTNRHVVENLRPQSIKITNKALGHALTARVLATSPPDPNETGAIPDFAILAVDQPGVSLLKMGPSTAKGSPVMAAGYPGFLIKDDQGYQRLIQGDLSASPDSTEQSGVVIQKRESDPVKWVTHSANLGRGNSGGPLLDLCGRVIGVNTAVKNEGVLSTTANLAQDVKELKTFLSSNGVVPEVDETSTPCPPATTTTPPGPAPPASGASSAPGATFGR